MARRKQAGEQTHVTAWPSSFPEDVGTDDSYGGGQSLDSDELGSHFLTDAVEQSRSRPPQWEDETDDEPYFDAKMGAELLRSFGLKPMPKRTTTRPKPPTEQPSRSAARDTMPRFTALRVPRDFEELIGREGDVDLTEETIREGSLLDREGDELGEVEAPSLTTEDVHTHGKRRGGHSRTSLRPPRMRKDGE